MAKPIKIACILDMLPGVGPSACGYIRLLLPLTKEVARGRLDVRFVAADDLDYFDVDVVITQRLALKSIAAVERVLAYCRKRGARLIYDLDDDLMAIGADHPEYAAYQAYAPVVLRLVTEADEVWTSTARLAERLAPFNVNTVLLQNELDARVWRPAAPEPHSEMRLLYMGTSSHRPDFEAIVRPAFAELFRTYGTGVSLDIVGVVSDGARAGERIITPPRATALAYPAFAAWLQRQPAYDIGLAPLTPTPFNDAKSHIKWLEYAALGLATVATDVGEYASSIRASAGGVLATAEGFVAALRALIDDPTRLLAARTAAVAGALENIAHGEANEPRLDRLAALADRRRAPSGRLVALDEIAGRVGRVTLSRAFLFGEGIEVGALHNPLAVERDVTVRYVDRMTRADLLTHYPELAHVNLVHVDIVDDGQKLATVPPDSQDFIIANHFLEHCEDPIAALKNFARVLRPGGMMYLALPDRRRTYDRDRVRTGLEHMVVDHVEGPQVSRRAHFHEWVTLVEPHFQRSYEGDAIDARIAELEGMDYSIHFHTFEPEDVVELVDYCAREQGLPLAIVFGGEFEDDEMIFILRKRLSTPPGATANSAQRFAQAGVSA